MANRWTEDQQNAIYAGGGSVLVSAAAGSGKTAVLVQRVIERLLDEENPCPVTNLLIVTFTKAAAGEMRSRLSREINKRMQEDPDNEWYQTQQMLLPSANICTIDAFCNSLVREHFDELEISPDFRMLDEEEEALLIQEALSDTMEQLYQKGDQSFRDLVELLFAGRDDSALENAILTLYRHSRAYPSPELWLRQAAEAYNPEGVTKENENYQTVLHNISEVLGMVEDTLSTALHTLSRDEEVAACNADSVISNDLGIVNRLQELIRNGQLKELREQLGSVTADTIRAGKKVPKENAALNKAKAAHNLFKEQCYSTASKPAKLYQLIPSSLEEMKEDCIALYPLVLELTQDVNLFNQNYLQLKSDQNALDFSDIELFAAKLLVQVKEDGSGFARTALAKELSAQYEEILLDEYQDTNALQDMLFSALSKEESNLFMVGDVKQSIYRFRKAMPELFLARKEAYTPYRPEAPVYPVTITLGKNFRSESGVLDYINFLFRQLMSKEAGDISYDQTEELVYGRTSPEKLSGCAELYLVEEQQGLKTVETEARFIAEYIIRAVQDSAGTEEPLTYKDFTVLLRVATGVANVYAKVFTDYGIPVYSESGDGFLSAPEIQIVLNLLRVIDNPLQDVPLLAVLLSPVFSFTEDEVALLRIRCKKKSLYQALLQEKEAGNEKCIACCNMLSVYRKLAVSFSAGELVRHIYDDTGLVAIASSLFNGEQRAANLRQLLNFADQYDDSHHFGISGFVRYLNRMEESGKDAKAPSTLSEAANVVRIMTVHKSKGLQFKVCILADLSHNFNKTELTGNLILHPRYGIGLKARDKNTGNSYTTIPYAAVKQGVEADSISESVRMLYVALTRAEKKLVLVGSVKGGEHTDKRLQSYAWKLNETLPVHPYVVKTQGNFLSWILLATLRHPSAWELRKRTSAVLDTVNTRGELEVRFVDPMTEADAPSEEQPATANPALVQTLKERFSYEYPYAALANVAIKRSASHLKETGFSAEYFASAVPEFLGKKGFTPAQRGTCLHKYMQYANFKNAAENPKAEGQRLVEKGFLSEAEMSVVSPEKVLSFFRSPLAERMLQSKQIMREKKFAVLLSAGTFDPELPAPLSEEKVLVQGIVDCAFLEEDGIVVLDYKTDRVKAPDQLVALYRDQILTYCNALEKCIGMPVKSAYLYSFSLEQEIPVPLAEPEAR